MLGDGSTKTFQIGQKLVRWVYLLARVSRVENLGGSAFQNRFGRTVGVPVSVTVSPPTRHTQRNRM